MCWNTFSRKIFKPMEMTARLLVVCVNRYVKSTFLFMPIRFSVGRWTKTRSYKFWHSRLCYIFYNKTVISELFSISATKGILYCNYFCYMYFVLFSKVTEKSIWNTIWKCNFLKVHYTTLLLLYYFFGFNTQNTLTHKWWQLFKAQHYMLFTITL